MAANLPHLQKANRLPQPNEIQNIFMVNTPDRFLFINKTANSKSLTQSQGAERECLFKHVQKNILPLAGRQRRALDRNHRGGPVTTSTRSRSKHISSPPRLNIKDLERTQLLSLFVHTHVSSLKRQDDAHDLQSFIWLSVLPTIPHSNTALSTSIGALVYAAFGQEHKDQCLIHASNVEYGVALRAVHASLSTSNETVAACLLLILYQFWSGHKGQGDWLAHVEGVGRIIQLRGPKAFQSGFAHTLFVCARSSIISAALNRRRRTFLEEERWRTVPWMNTTKTEYASMLDVLAGLPSTCEFFDEVQRLDDREMQSRQRLVLLERLWERNAQLVRWYEKASISARPIGLVPLTELNLDQQLLTVFPESYEFPSLAKANMFRLFCASSVDVYNMLAITYAALDAAGVQVPFTPSEMRYQSRGAEYPSTNGDGLAQSGQHFCTSDVTSISQPHLSDYTSTASYLENHCRSLAMSLADEVCKSLQYCLRKEHSTAGRYLSVAPMKFAIWCYRINLSATESRLKWAYAAVKMLAESGISFSVNLLRDRPYGLKKGEAK